MKKTTYFDQIIRIVGLICFALCLSGVNYCQKDYELGAQASSTTATPTATPTPDDGTGDDDDDDDETPVLDDTPTPTATATATPTATPETQALIFEELSRVSGASASSDSEDEDVNKDSSGSLGNSFAAAGSQASGGSGNWLGNVDSGGLPRDSDGDGYLDAFEEKAGTDPSDPRSFGPAPVTRLALRFQGIDDDLDGLSNAEEIKLGLDPNLRDSDGDKAQDGAEKLSGTDPLDASDTPYDSDSDGLSDDYEEKGGLNAHRNDTDGDRLRDDHELVMGTNAKNPDSDNDGIMDGKEVELGSDPARFDDLLENE